MLSRTPIGIRYLRHVIQSLLRNIRQCFFVGYNSPPLVPLGLIRAPDDSRSLSVLGNRIPNYQIQHLIHFPRAPSVVCLRRFA